MSQSFRLKEGGRIDRRRKIRFQFNGKSYYGYEGDTLASALLANGVHFVARSWKYHRPRGIMTAGVEEPNAIVQLETGAYTVPNAKATEIPLYDELQASSVNVSPSLAQDKMAVVQKFSRFLPAGFYYKTFMWPQKYWPRFEEKIRELAGLGVAPKARDADRYEKQFMHADILVVGAGPAGLAAALAAGKGGARVILLDDQAEAGGTLLSSDETIDGVKAVQWVAGMMQALAELPNVKVFLRTTAFGYQDHNLVTACQRLTDHLPLAERKGTRERILKIRARQVILATGAHERPLVFANNDLPGIMLSGAIASYVNRYAILPGKSALIFTNNDEGYRAAIALKQHGANVTVIDARPVSGGTLPQRAHGLGVSILFESVVVEAFSEQFDHHIEKVSVAAYRKGHLGEVVATLCCDLLGVSGGWNPVVHLFAQSGGKAVWSEEKACFVPGVSVQEQASVGAAKGDFLLAEALAGGQEVANAALGKLGLPAAPPMAWELDEYRENAILPLWLIGDRAQMGQGEKQFVDFQNDVSAADIYLAAREGYQSVEHVKRYTALGFGTDQGKLGNINGMAILAEALQQTIPQTGTTTYRPNYTPVTFGALAGRELGDFFEPVRTTCIHAWHEVHGAVFEDVGNWKRPLYYALDNEDMQAAVRRECLAVRNGVGILDASTLGKIDVQGPDAAEFLNRMYTNAWNKLGIGKCRYGLMLDENGMVFDDGVNIRLGENHYLLSTTTGGAARVMQWMEKWLQTEWPELKVHLASLTDHYSTFAVAGPNARKVLQKVCHDIDFAAEQFPFMSFREGHIMNVPVRIMRISFSGELCYEVNVPSNYGRAVWDTLIQAGQEFDITPYGTEAMHVLRAEKGFIIVGQDTDGSMTPADLGMDGLVAKTKDFIGKRSLSRSHTAGSGRKQFVGLLSEDPQQVLPEGAQVLREETIQRPAPMLGQVTSSYYSPTLERSIALAVIKDGFSLMGSTVVVWSAQTGFIKAQVCSPVFFDEEGSRQHAA